MKKFVLVSSILFFIWGCEDKNGPAKLATEPVTGTIELNTASGVTGMVFYTQDQFLKVQRVLPNSPAEKAGIQVRDVVREVNGEKIKELPKDEALGLLTGHAGDMKSVVIRRAGEPELLTFDLVLAELYYRYEDYGFGYKHRGDKVMHYSDYLDFDPQYDFEVLGENWARNGDTIFYKAQKVEVAHPESFKALDAEKGEDKAYIYQTQSTDDTGEVSLSRKSKTP